jgi:hypothetical protein
MLEDHGLLRTNSQVIAAANAKAYLDSDAALALRSNSKLETTD